MRIRVWAHRTTWALRELLRRLARPGRGAAGRGGLVVQPYRGYGSAREVFLIGRVFRQRPPRSTSKDRIGSDLAEIGRRITRRGVADADLAARFGGTQQRVTTDADGYFRVHLHPPHAPPTDRLWHPLQLELLSPRDAGPVHAEADVFIPPASARFVVVSDIDDTVMLTGVARKLRMLWRLFVEGAESRTAFPGVGSFYQALHEGGSGAEFNPMLYVSRGPWGLYELLVDFFNAHRIPVGPILFLREWGLRPRRPWPRAAHGHKLALIRNILTLYAELPFVLVGDSGQRDPEIYAQVVREHPGRVKAIYIRNVSRDPKRPNAIARLAQEVTAAGSTLLLAADSYAMARHAAEHGLIAPEALSRVLAERQAEGETGPLHPTRHVGGSPDQTGAVIDAGVLDKELHGQSGDQAPPNIEVEAREKPRKR